MAGAPGPARAVTFMRLLMLKLTLPLHGYLATRCDVDDWLGNEDYHHGRETAILSAVSFGRTLS